MGQRGAGAVFMPSKYVFPGGAVDAGDAEVPLAAPLSDHSAALLAGSVPSAHALAVAAIRELFEETGLTLGRSGAWPLPPEGWHGFAARGLVPDASGLRLIFRAITPPGRPRRPAPRGPPLRRGPLGGSSAPPPGRPAGARRAQVFPAPAVSWLIHDPVRHPRGNEAMSQKHLHPEPVSLPQSYRCVLRGAAIAALAAVILAAPARAAEGTTAIGLDAAVAEARAKAPSLLAERERRAAAQADRAAATGLLLPRLTASGSWTVLDDDRLGATPGQPLYDRETAATLLRVGETTERLRTLSVTGTLPSCKRPRHLQRIGRLVEYAQLPLRSSARCTRGGRDRDLLFNLGDSRNEKISARSRSSGRFRWHGCRSVVGDDLRRARHEHRQAQ